MRVRGVACVLLGLLAVAVRYPRRSAPEASRASVKDSSGGILPGATVQATSPSLVGVQTVVTDEREIIAFRR